MADRPSRQAEWSNDIVQELVTINEIPTLIDNRIEPTQAWKDSGELYQENLPRQYLNDILYILSQWQQNLDERAFGTVGDVYTSTISYATATLDNRFGGTWTARGTDTLGTIATLYVYERTA